MSVAQKEKKQKVKVPSQSGESTLAEQLKSVIKSLNEFLKQHFDRSLGDSHRYANLVKQYFIQESTKTSYSCLISSLFSKISNMLQPFLATLPCAVESQEEYKLKEQISMARQRMEKQGKKLRAVNEELNKYKQTSNRLTHFIYMLRVNNIDVDSLYEKGWREEKDRDNGELSRQSNTEILMQHEVSNFQTR